MGTDPTAQHVANAIGLAARSERKAPDEDALRRAISTEPHATHGQGRATALDPHLTHGRHACDDASPLDVARSRRH